MAEQRWSPHELEGWEVAPDALGPAPRDVEWDPPPRARPALFGLFLGLALLTGFLAMHWATGFLPWVLLELVGVETEGVVVDRVTGRGLALEGRLYTFEYEVDGRRYRGSSHPGGTLAIGEGADLGGDRVRVHRLPGLPAVHSLGEPELHPLAGFLALGSVTFLPFVLLPLGPWARYLFSFLSPPVPAAADLARRGELVVAIVETVEGAEEPARGYREEATYRSGRAIAKLADGSTIELTFDDAPLAVGDRVSVLRLRGSRTSGRALRQLRGVRFVGRRPDAS